MSMERRYNVHFLVAPDGDQYSALCYEFTTVGCGPDVQSALTDAIHATIEYLEYLIQAGRGHEVRRPAPPELVLEYLDVPTEGEISREQVNQALHAVIVASAVLERKLKVEYDSEKGRIYCDLPQIALPHTQDGLTNYPVELVFAGE